MIFTPPIPMEKQWASPVEIKSMEEDGHFSGYASTYTPDRHKDVMVPGAFRGSLNAWRQDKKWPPLLWQHDAHVPLGLWRHMKEDHRGLFVVGQLLLDAPKAREIYAFLKKGAFCGLSIGFRSLVSRYDAAQQLRKIFQVDLMEISIVTLPANPKAGIHHIKSLSPS